MNLGELIEIMPDTPLRNSSTDEELTMDEAVQIIRMKNPPPKGLFNTKDGIRVQVEMAKGDNESNVAIYFEKRSGQIDTITIDASTASI